VNELKSFCEHKTMRKIVVYMDVDKTWGWRYYNTDGRIKAKSYDPIESSEAAIKEVGDVIMGSPEIIVSP
jgi:hypothetical protein